MENIIYPIRFRSNTCVHCGKDGTLRFKDKFGNIVFSPVYAVESLICTNCNREYPIKWEKSEKTGKMVPTGCSDILISEFEQDIIKFSLENKRKL